MVNLTNISRIKFLMYLCLCETGIWIYTKCAGMGINLLNIYYTIQFKISNNIILLKLFQRLGRKEKNVFYLAIAIVFIEIR